MPESEITQVYLLKAEQSLAGAESELINGRYNNAANRCYYACFQAAVAALTRQRIQPGRGSWRHEFVQGEFVGTLINRQKRYPSDLRDVLSRNLILRQTADYEPIQVTQVQAYRAVRRTRTFLGAIQEKGGGKT